MIIKILSFFPIIASLISTTLAIIMSLFYPIFVFLVIGNILSSYLLIDTRSTFEETLNNIYKHITT